MKNTMLASLIVLSSCAGYEPAQKKDLSFVFVEQTGLSKKDAFNKTLAYLAKNLGNSNYAIQLKDESQGKIVTKIANGCNQMQASMDLTTYTASYVLEADIKDKKVKLNFEADTFSQINIDGSVMTANGSYRSGHLEALKACATELKNEIIAALGKTEENW